MEPAKKHPDFEQYVAWIDKAAGLYYLKAVGRDISTSRYGTEFRLEFDNLLETLSKTYGTYRNANYLQKESLWDDDKYWMSGILDKERKFYFGTKIQVQNWEIAL